MSQTAVTILSRPVEGCTRIAAGAWHYSPCGAVVRKAVWPGVRHTLKQLPQLGQEFQPTSTGMLNRKKRPWRQRMCRFVFREFLRSCGIAPGAFHLEALKPWQIALGSGVLGALVMWIAA